jgi:cation diffusion facilitator CzcD-associated flavoprotein CzcO
MGEYRACESAVAPDRKIGPNCPTPYTGQRVIVVGARNSAVPIAVELAQHAYVTLASRQTPCPTHHNAPSDETCTSDRAAPVPKLSGPAPLATPNPLRSRRRNPTPKGTLSRRNSPTSSTRTFQSSANRAAPHHQRQVDAGDGGSVEVDIDQ